jgi:hypothetical protein
MMELLKEFNFNISASEQIIKQVEVKLNFCLPQEYYNFLIQGNGGEGFIGESYAIFWKLEELIEWNHAYQVNEYAPGLFLFGSNGGGEAFAFDLRKLPTKIVQIPFIVLGLEDIMEIRDSFLSFLNYLYHDS